MSYEKYRRDGKYSFALRSEIVAPTDHYLLELDFKQAESWIVAYLADEPRMKKALQKGDIHTLSGAVISESELILGDIGHLMDDPLFWSGLSKEITPHVRYTGKRFNHATSYRMGWKRATEVINKDSDKPPYVTVTFKQSKRFMELWHGFYDLSTWWRSIEEAADKTRTITTPYGRLRVFFAQYGMELFKEMTAYNPQSTASDHLKGAVQDELGVEGGLRKVSELYVTPGTIKIINESHDSFLSEIPKTAIGDLVEPIVDLVQRPLVINGETFTIPVEVKWGERRGELELWNESETRV